MTREDQIKQAADYYTDEELAGAEIVEEHVHTAFAKGVEWADKNPLKYGGFTDDQFAKAPLHIHDECQSRYEVLKGQHALVVNDYLAVKEHLGIAIEALEKIMKAGTGRQGNALYTEDAYEALAKINPHRNE